MKKAMSLILAVCFILALCGCSSSKLAEQFNEDEVTARAKEVIGTINTFDYETVVSQLREDLKSQLTAKQLEDSWGEQLKAAGAFVDYTSSAVAGTKDKATGEDYAVCVVVCKYENASHTYTISVDKNLDLVGLYMK